MFIADSANAGILNLLPRRVKTVVYLTGLAFQEDERLLGIEVDLKDRLIRLASHVFKRRGLFLCDLLFTISDQVKRDFERFAWKNTQQEVIAAPLGLATFFERTDSSDLRRQLGFAPETKVILSVAAPYLSKNMGTLIQALERLESQLADWKWVHIGTLHPSVRTNISEGIRNRMLLLDYIEDFSDMPRFYSMADVFVLPTLYEGFGWPPLEAAACGCPVVVSNIAPINENLRNVALFVDPTSAKEVEEGIYRVLTEPELASDLSVKGPVVKERFTWSRTVDIVLSGIHSLKTRRAT